MTSRVGETDSDFRARLAQAARERRDLEAAKIRKRYEPKLATLQNRLLRAQQAVDRESSQAAQKKIDTAISFGTALVGAFLGRKRLSVSTASRVSTAVGKASRIGKERADVARARETAASIQEEMTALDDQLGEELAQIESSFDPALEELEEMRIRAASKDVTVSVFGLAWRPFRRSDGQLTPDW